MLLPIVSLSSGVEIPPNGHCDSAKRAFRCDDGRCLPRDQVCDISRDCPGGEDEDQDCGIYHLLSLTLFSSIFIPSALPS